jgi:hypothetical protein
MHFLCVFIYILVSFGHDPDVWHDGASGSRHHCPARVSGLDRGVWHDGASGSRHHRFARGFDHDPGDRHYGLFSARSSPRDTSDRAGTAVDTPAERDRHRRPLATVVRGMSSGTKWPQKIAPSVGAAPAASGAWGVRRHEGTFVIALILPSRTVHMDS